MLYRAGTALAFMLAMACVSPPASARKMGPEFRPNTGQPQTQPNTAVARLNDGGFVVAWGSIGGDGWGNVSVQRYNAAGAQVGAEFQVNTTTTDNEQDPSIAGLSDGGFVVTWTRNVDGGSQADVYGQRYNAAGAAVHGNFRVNIHTVNNQWKSSVAGLGGGGFVVAWNSVFTANDGLPYSKIVGMLYSAAGGRVGGEFQINTFKDGWRAPKKPSAAALDDGGFVVVWHAFQDISPPETTTPNSYGVYGQRYDAAAAPVGTEFPVNSYKVNSQINPSVAPLGNGGFVVTWQSVQLDDPDGAGFYGVYGQRFTAAGAPAGHEFRVNSYVVNHQLAPSVAALNDGGYVVTWTSYGQDNFGQDVNGGVYGQRYKAVGGRSGSEFLVNSTITGDQTTPAVAGLGNGGYVVTWSSEADQSPPGPHGQRFRP